MNYWKKKEIETFECCESNDCNILTKDYLILIRNESSNGLYIETFDKLNEGQIALLSIREVKKCEK